jgi:hypothetical protein
VSEKLENDKIKLELFEKWVDTKMSFYKIGDKIIYVYYVVTKPTHNSFGKRLRYEEERRYVVGSGTVERIVPLNGLYGLTEIGLICAIENKENYPHKYISDGRIINYTDIFNSVDLAKAHAESCDASYKEHCRRASSYR